MSNRIKRSNEELKADRPTLDEVKDRGLSIAIIPLCILIIYRI